MRIVVDVVIDADADVRDGESSLASSVARVCIPRRLDVCGADDVTHPRSEPPRRPTTRARAVARTGTKYALIIACCVRRGVRWRAYASINAGELRIQMFSR